MTAVTAAPATLRLALRPPFDGAGVLRWLAARLVPGVEALSDGVYRRTLDLPGGPGVVTLAPRADHVEAVFALDDAADLPAAEARCRHLLDLDADPAAPAAVLASDPVLAPLVAARPGLRAPGSVDPAETAVRAVLGQQVSLAAARTLAGRLVAACGPPLADARGTPDPSLPRAGGHRRRDASWPRSACRARAGGRCWRCAPAWPRATSSSTRPRIPAQSGRSCSRSRASGRGRPTTSCSARSAIPTPFRPATSACAARPAPSASPTTPPASRPAPSAGGPGGATPRTTSGRRGHEVRPRRHADRDADLVASDDGLREIRFAGGPPPDGAAEAPGDRVLAEAARQLGEWFAGERTAFDLPLDLGAATPFQRRAWLALAEVPYATTRSYGEQARPLGAPRAARAVGAANGRNPLPVVLPCHRLVGADGSLTGFGGGLDVKRALLDHEAATAARAAGAGSARTRTSPAPRPRT